MIPEPKPELPPLRFLLIGAMVIALGPLTIDMYLPAMPAIQREFKAATADVQATMAVYLIGLAFGQLLYGPTSDAYGRKKPLLVGMLIYIVAAVGCALAPSTTALIWLRLLQAIGGCAGAVTVRAMIRDRYPEHEVARALSLLTLIMGVAPIVAPLLGGYLFTHFGWRSIFWVLAVFAIVATALVMLRVDETRPNASGHISFDYLWRNYARMLRHRRFMGFAGAGAVIQAGLFAYISSAPFLFTEGYGVAAHNVGPLFALSASAYIAGSQVNRHLLKRIRAEVLMRRAILAYCGATCAMLVLALTGFGGLPMLMIAIAAAMASMGFSFPNSTAVALAPFGDRAGLAASLMGTLQFALAASASFVLGHLHSHSAVPVASVMLGGGVLAQVALRVLVKPRGPGLDPRRSRMRDRR